MHSEIFRGIVSIAKFHLLPLLSSSTPVIFLGKISPLNLESSLKGDQHGLFYCAWQNLGCRRRNRKKNKKSNWET